MLGPMTAPVSADDSGAIRFVLDGGVHCVRDEPPTTTILESIDRLVCPIGLSGIVSKQPEAIAIAVAAQLLRTA